jgi:hypothetical protein
MKSEIWPYVQTNWPRRIASPDDGNDDSIVRLAPTYGDSIQAYSTLVAEHLPDKVSPAITPFGLSVPFSGCVLSLFISYPIFTLFFSLFFPLLFHEFFYHKLSLPCLKASDSLQCSSWR